MTSFFLFFNMTNLIFVNLNWFALGKLRTKRTLTCRWVISTSDSITLHHTYYFKMETYFHRLDFPFYFRYLSVPNQNGYHSPMHPNSPSPALIPQPTHKKEMESSSVRANLKLMVNTAQQLANKSKEEVQKVWTPTRVQTYEP